jgi:hypothetical protein
VPKYIGSLLRRPLVHQAYAADDLEPCVQSYRDGCRAVLRRLAQVFKLPTETSRPTANELAPLHDVPSTARSQREAAAAPAPTHSEERVGTVQS